MPMKRFWKRLRWFLAIAGVGGVVLLVVLCLCRVIFFSGPFSSVDGNRASSVVDIHCHTAGIGAGESGCFVSKALRSSYKFRIYLDSFGVNLPALKANGDALVVQRIAERVRDSKQVDAAIVLAMDGVIDEKGRLDRSATQFYVPNQFVLQETAKYPELFFGASINPKRTNAVELLTWAHANGAKLVKWLPSIQLFDPNDRSLLPFYHKMAELDLPLLSHAGRERSFTYSREEFSDPQKLQLALDAGVTVIVAHIASTGQHEGERDTDRLKAMMKRYPRLYSEISSLTQANKLGYLKEALRDEVFQGRLFYGSDYPLINTLLVSPWYFQRNLKLSQMKTISEIENPWDRDVALKRALGVPSEVFERARLLLMSPEDFNQPK